MNQESFERALKRYDPLLSLRWGPHVRAWVVDRKAPKGISKALWDTLEWAAQQPKCEPIDRERYDSAKLGNRPVLHTPVLGNHVFNELYVNDLQVHGTKVVDRHMARLEAQRTRKRNDDTWSRSAADALEFLNRKSVELPEEAKQEVFRQAAGMEPKRKKKVVDKLGAPPKWMSRESATIGA